MEHVLVNIIKRIIKEQNLDVGVVRNLLGAIPEDFDEEEITHPSEWAAFYLNSLELLAPHSIIERLSSVDLQTASIIKGTNGSIKLTTNDNGTVLVTTIVSVPRPTGIPLSVTANGRQISVYLDEVLIKRSVNKIETSINLPAGDTPISVILTGATTANVTINLPSDVRTSFSSYIPDIPIWRTGFPIQTNYIDPKTGQTGNILYWINNPSVGGWGVYLVESNVAGTFTSCKIQDEDTYFVTLSGTSNTPGYSTIMHVDSGILGDVQGINLRETGEYDLVIRLQEHQDPSFVIDQAAYSYVFKHLADIKREGTQEQVNFTHLGAESGLQYSYTLDAFSRVDPSIRSAKSVIKTITAGDITPPTSITITSFTVIDGIAYVSYTTPSSEDYLGVHVYYNNVNSGTVDSLLLDFGLPNMNDGLQFKVINSGTYYFRSFDIVGNEQTIASGISYFWDGGQITFDVNVPPTVSVKLLSSAETTTDGYDPLLYARFELNAVDPDASGSVSVEYRTRDNSPGSWTAAGALPAKINVSRKARDNWIQVRATDGEDYSDIVTVAADYDQIPEVSSLSGRIDVNSNTVYINGAVDDDTKSIRWEVRENTANGTLINSGVGLNMGPGGNKAFDFSFPIPDGSRRYLSVYPYSEDDLGGTLYVGYPEVFELPPRTRALITERSSGGAVTRTDALLTLSKSPSNANTYIRIDPVSLGVATGGTSNTLVDSTKINYWNDDEFNTGYEVIIYTGTGSGQVRDIIDTVKSTGTITVSPDWTVTPDTTSGYRIRENYYSYTIPIVVSRSIDFDKTVNFYSEIELTAGVYLTETPQSVIIDYDVVPEIHSGSAIETSSKTITVTIFNIDEDAKTWELYGRKDSWPTKNGTQLGSLDTAYIKTRKSTNDSNITFRVENGEWRFIVAPLDSFFNYGPKLYFTVPISDTSDPATPGVLDVYVSAYDNSPTAYYNRLTWTHNSDAEKPAGNGTVTVKVYAYRSDEGPESEVEITDPTTRYVWQDSEDGNSYSNSDDTSNSISSQGSMVHQVDRRTPEVGTWLTWYYLVKVYDSSTLIGTFETELSDWYGPLI